MKLIEKMWQQINSSSKTSDKVGMQSKLGRAGSQNNPGKGNKKHETEIKMLFNQQYHHYTQPPIYDIVRLF